MIAEDGSTLPPCRRARQHMVYCLCGMRAAINEVAQLNDKLLPSSLVAVANYSRFKLSKQIEAPVDVADGIHQAVAVIELYTHPRRLGALNVGATE